ncbi:lecithin retinol acyltransferase family protein [Endozoicomonas elysicola]|uniref:Membrane protein n=1 Tax=Endozoicomonas elysicola TaxID=305900 RepID=A0A081K7M6_9GAMM|nr:lecithin retinol acyltransferase family protein [Endozoicomonas elysicola]KEI70152.1 membrane protein [Endozoicomonas elysicola]
MKSLLVNPGDVVVTDFGIYQHWSFVSDTVCSRGKPMLISATKRNGTVKEETWDTVTQGKNTYITKVQKVKAPSEILNTARSQIGKWKYSVESNNCEHFVKWASGLEVTSAQVVNTSAGLITGAVLVGVVAENPKFVHFLGGALLVAGIFLALTRASEKVTAE